MIKLILSILLLIIGFTFLIVSANYFVEGSSNLAGHFKLPKVIVGLTIVAFGTSVPELAISIQSMISGSGEMVIGSVLGSNITNVLLIVGACSMFGAIHIKSSTLRKEIPILFLLSVLFSVLYFDNLFDSSVSNILTRSDGIVILLFFLVFIYYIVSYIRKTEKLKIDKPKISLFRSIFYIITGLIVIVFSSDLVVESATDIAIYLNVSQRIISLTIIAFGTSLPELVTGIVAVKKGESELLLGNVIGSSIFNICLVLALPLVLFGDITGAVFSGMDFIILILSSTLLYIFASFNYRVDKYEGILLLCVYVFYYACTFAC